MENWIILAIISAFFTALTIIFTKAGVSHIDVSLASALETAIILVFLLVMCAIFGTFGDLKSVDLKSLAYIIVAGFCGALSWVVYLLALRHGPASKIAALDVSLIFVVLLAVFTGEPLTTRGIVGAIFATVGTVMIMW